MKSGVNMEASSRRVRRRGFTLVELLVVVGILALIAAILLPIVSESRRSSQTTVLVSQIRKLGALAQSAPDGTVWPITMNVVMPSAATFTPPVTGTNLATSSADQIASATRLDQVFLSLGFIDRLLQTPLVAQNTPSGNDAGWAAQDVRWNAASSTFFNSPDSAVTHSWDVTARVECGVTGAIAMAGAPTGASGFFTFKPDGLNELPANHRIQFVVLPGISSDVAFVIAKQINQSGLMDSDVAGVAQTRGPATYAAPVGGLTTVFIFLALQ